MIKEPNIKRKYVLQEGVHHSKDDEGNMTEHKKGDIIELNDFQFKCYGERKFKPFEAVLAESQLAKETAELMELGRKAQAKKAKKEQDRLKTEAVSELKDAVIDSDEETEETEETEEEDESEDTDTEEDAPKEKDEKKVQKFGNPKVTPPTTRPDTVKASAPAVRGSGIKMKA